MRETCDTGRKCPSHIGIDQCHLRCLIEILVMHVLDRIQCVDIQTCQPVHHHIILLNHFVIVQILAGDRCVCRADLLLCLKVTSSVHRVQQAFRKVRTRAEELHLLTGLCRRYAAADRIVIAPYWTHHIVILILDGTRAHGDNGRIFFKVLRQMRGIQHREVWLRGRSHVL